MSKTNVPIVKIDTDPAKKSLKDLRKELKDLKDQMVNLEEGSDAFREVAKQAGEVKHQMDEINESVRGASSDFGDMIGNVTNTAAGITGAFQAVAGGLQAFGVESEAIDQAIVKMQGLMAVTQGLSAIDDGVKSFGKLTKSINLGSKSLSGFKKALIGTGIGALVVVLGSIIANWDEFTKSIGFSEEALEKFGNKAKGVLNSVKEMFSGIGKGITRIFTGDWAGAKEAFKQGFQFQQNFNEGVRKAEEENNQKRLEEAKVQFEKEYEIKKEQLNRTDDEITKNKELLKLEQNYLKYLNKGSIEYEKQLTNIKNLKDQIVQLENEQVEAAQQRKEAAAEEARLEKEKQNRITLLQIDLSDLSDLEKLNAQLTVQTNILAEIVDETSEEYLKQLKIVNSLIESIEELQKKEADRTYNLSEQQKTYWKTFEKYTQEVLSPYDLFKKEQDNLEELYKQNIITEAEYIEASNNLRKEKNKKFIADVTAVTTAASGLVTDILSSVADQQDTTTKEGFEKSKKLQIASATIQMLTGIATALSGAFTSKTGPWDIALAAIQAASIAAAGAFNINKIKQTTFDSAGSASVSSSSVSRTIIPPVQYSQAVHNATTEGAIKDTKVYVTENDITNTINKVSVQERENQY